MDIALLSAQRRVRRRQRLRWSLGGAMAAAALVVLPSVLLPAPAEQNQPLSRAVHGYQFGLLAWEQRHVAARADSILGALFVAPRPASDAAALTAYLRAPTPAARADARSAAAAALEAEITQEATAEGLAIRLPFREPLLFPPVSTWIGPPPQVLIVSPRDRIEVRDSTLLDPDLSVADAEQIEARADGTGVSSLVVPVGGLSTYPAMVVDSTSPQTLIAMAAHEWAHGYLFFRPLGQAYFTSYEGRAINETVAESFGRELGERIAARLDLHLAPPPSAPPPAPGFDANAYLRETRRVVDGLLARGQVDAAERYMEQRRRALVNAGFPIRKLNQAYFAFYGSYTQGPAAPSTSPIPDQVRRLRQESASLGDFLRRAAALRSAADLARAVGDAP